MTLIELLALAAGFVGLLFGLGLGARVAGLLGAIVLGPVSALIGLSAGLTLQLAVVGLILRFSKEKDSRVLR